MEPNKNSDHEAAMAKAELLQIAKNAMSLFQMIQEGDELDGWVSSHITIANDHLNSVQEHLEYGEVSENKKGVRAPKRITKPRNPVAKNAMATIGGGGAGAHKDKKKAAKQGEVKHKKPAYEDALHQALAQSLEVMEGYGRYWCSTDKKWKERKGPKQSRK